MYIYIYIYHTYIYLVSCVCLDVFLAVFLVERCSKDYRWNLKASTRDCCLESGSDCNFDNRKNHTWKQSRRKSVDFGFPLDFVETEAESGHLRRRLTGFGEKSKVRYFDKTKYHTLKAEMKTPIAIFCVFVALPGSRGFLTRWSTCRFCWHQSCCTNLDSPWWKFSHTHDSARSWEYCNICGIFRRWHLDCDWILWWHGQDLGFNYWKSIANVKGSQRFSAFCMLFTMVKFLFSPMVFRDADAVDEFGCPDYFPRQTWDVLMTVSQWVNRPPSFKGLKMKFPPQAKTACSELPSCKTWGAKWCESRAASKECIQRFFNDMKKLGTNLQVVESLDESINKTSCSV